MRVGRTKQMDLSLKTSFCRPAKMFFKNPGALIVRTCNRRQQMDVAANEAERLIILGSSFFDCRLNFAPFCRGKQARGNKICTAAWQKIPKPGPDEQFVICWPEGEFWAWHGEVRGSLYVYSLLLALGKTQNLLKPTHRYTVELSPLVRLIFNRVSRGFYCTFFLRLAGIGRPEKHGKGFINLSGAKLMPS